MKARLAVCGLVMTAAAVTTNAPVKAAENLQGHERWVVECSGERSETRCAMSGRPQARGKHAKHLEDAYRLAWQVANRPYGLEERLVVQPVAGFVQNFEPIAVALLLPDGPERRVSLPSGAVQFDGDPFLTHLERSHDLDVILRNPAGVVLRLGFPGAGFTPARQHLLKVLRQTAGQQ